MGLLSRLFLACNTNVEVIDKSRTNIAAIPPEIMRYAKTLLELNLEVNNIASIPLEFWKLTRLRHLNISDNRINQLSSQIGNFTLLTHLDISRNDIRSLPDELGHLVNLAFLDISGNPLSNRMLPHAIWKLHNLRKLSANDVCLCELPEDICNLTKLEVLELGENVLSTLPVSIGVLVNLKILDLGGNDIYELPYEIGELVSLKDLFLNNNELYELPKTIGDLKNLECLDLTKNELDSIPEQIGKLVKLTQLLLDFNDLRTIPSSISNLRQLTILKIVENDLDSIPTSLGRCSLITELIITSNNLDSIPSSIGNLVNLRTVNFDQNVLKSIPESIGNCTKLSVLSLRNNHLTFIPTSIGKLVNLRVLDLANNRLESLPAEVANLKDLRALWLSETQGSVTLPTLNLEMRDNRKVLTCMLLPQKTASMENLLTVSRDSLHVLKYYSGQHEASFITGDEYDASKEGDYDTGEGISPREDGQIDVKEEEQPGVARRRPHHNTGAMSAGQQPSVKRDSKVSFDNDDVLSVDDSELNDYTKPGVVFGKSNNTCCETHSTEIRRLHTPHPRELAARREAGGISVQRSDSGRRRQETHIVLSSSNLQIAAPPSSPCSTSPMSPRPPSEDTSNGPKPHPSSYDPSSANKMGGANSDVTRIAQITTMVAVADVTPDFAAAHRPSSISSTYESGKETQSSKVLHKSPSNSSDVPPKPPVRTSFNRVPPNDRRAVKEPSSKGGCSKPPALQLDPRVFSPSSSFSQRSNNSTSSVAKYMKLRVEEDNEKEAESTQNDNTSMDSLSQQSDSDEESREKTVGFSGHVVLSNGGGPDARRIRDDEHDDQLLAVDTVESVVKFRHRDPPTREASFLTRRDTPHHKKGKRLLSDDRELTEEDLQQLLGSHYGGMATTGTISSSASNSTTTGAHQQLSPSFRQQQPYSISSDGLHDGTKYEVEHRHFKCVVTRGAGVGYGLTIAGGKGSPTPYKPDDHGIFLSNVIVNSPAFVAGLKVGDKILSVDGNDFSDVDHTTAIGILRGSGISITLTVERRIFNLLQDSDGDDASQIEDGIDERGLLLSGSTTGTTGRLSTQSSQSQKDQNGSLGRKGVEMSSSHKRDAFFEISIVLKREMHQTFGFSFSASQSKGGLKVTKIAPGGVAQREGTLMLGDVIQKINDVDVTNGTEGRDSAVNILRSDFEVCIDVKREESSASSTTGDSSVFSDSEFGIARKEKVPVATSGRVSAPDNQESNVSQQNQTGIKLPNSFSETSGLKERLSQLESDNKDGKLDHVEEISIVKTGEPLGFSIKGGTDHPMYICGLKDTSIYISKISDSGLARRSSLVVGDKILAVNGNSLNKVTHAEAVKALVAPCGDNKLTLLVAHENFLSGYTVVNLSKHESELWGISILGGIGYESANPYDPVDECIYITNILPFSPADLSQKLKSGHRILEINNRSMVGVTYPEAKHELNISKTRLKITVCDGFNVTPTSTVATTDNEESNINSPYKASTLIRTANSSAISTNAHQNENNSHLSSSRSANDDVITPKYGSGGGGVTSSNMHGGYTSIRTG